VHGRGVKRQCLGLHAFKLLVFWRLLVLVLLAGLLVLVLADVVDADHPPEDLGTVKVVHAKDRAALVLVRNECKAFGPARLLVTHEIDIDDFAKPFSRTYQKSTTMGVFAVLLRKDANHIALGQLVRQPARKDVRRVFVLQHILSLAFEMRRNHTYLVVPRAHKIARVAARQLALVDALDLLDDATSIGG